MRQVLTAPQSFLATVHRFNEAVFLVQIVSHGFLYQFVGITALLSGGLLELRFEFGRKMNLHIFSLREKRPSGNFVAHTGRAAPELGAVAWCK